MQKLSLIAIGAIFTFTGATVNATDAGINSFFLWSTDAESRYIDFDINPSTSGVELLVFGENATVAPAGTDLINVTTKINFKVRSPDGKSQVDILSRPFVTSTGPIPDPEAQSSIDNNICYEGETDPDADTVCAGWPNALEDIIEDVLAPAIGFGIADAAGGDVLVVGTGIAGYWFGNGSDSDFGEFRAFMYNASNLNFICKLSFPAAEGTVYLDYEISSVGDFLSAGGRSGQDELRVFTENEDDGTLRVRFYDPTTCEKLSATNVAPPIL